MDYLLYVALVLLSAVIGMVTNYLAIKMLFHPYKEKKLFGIRIPFTPGIIPRNRHRIAVSLAEMMDENVFKEDVIKEEINGKIEKIDFTKELFNNTKIKDLFNNSDDDIASISKKISGFAVNKFVEENYASKIVNSILETFKPKLGFFAGMLGNIGIGIEEQINNYVKNNGPEELSKIINEELVSFASNDIESAFNKLNTSSNAFISKIVVKGSDKLIDKVIKEIDFKEMIIKQIDLLDIKAFEKMILNVVRKELRAITYLGGLLGGILGLLNILFINVL